MKKIIVGGSLLLFFLILFFSFQELLPLTHLKSIITKQVSVEGKPTSNLQISTKIYLGSVRMDKYFPTGKLSPGTSQYNLPQTLPENTFVLGGRWTVGPEYLSPITNSRLVTKFRATKVYLVMRTSSEDLPSQLRVYIDGKLVSDENAGVDVVNGIVTVRDDRLYELIDVRGVPGDYILELEFLDSRTQLFSLTFG